MKYTVVAIRPDEQSAAVLAVFTSREQAHMAARAIDALFENAVKKSTMAVLDEDQHAVIL